MKRCTPSVAHKDLAQFTEPTGWWLKELQTTNRCAFCWRIWITRNIVGLLKRSSPRCVGWILRALLSMFFRVEMNQVVLGGFWEDHARFAPMLFRVVDYVVEFLFSKNREILIDKSTQLVHESELWKRHEVPWRFYGISFCKLTSLPPPSSSVSCSPATLSWSFPATNQSPIF